MDAPPAFQRHADQLVKGTFRDSHKLWAALQSYDKNASLLCKQAKASGPLNQKLYDVLVKVYDKMKKDSSNRSRKNLSRTSNATTTPASAGSVPKGAGKGKGEPQLYDMVLAEDEVFFIDDEPAPIFDLTNMLHDTTGVTYTSATQAGVALRKAQGRPTRRPCVVVCKKLAFDACSTMERKEILTHFKPDTMTLHFREPRGPPKAIVCLAFQIGVEAVTIRDVSADPIVDIVSDRPFLTKLSISIPNLNEAKDFHKRKDNFVTDTTAMVGQKLLAGEVKYTRTREDFKLRKKIIHVHQGIVFVTPEHLEMVLRRSGHNGICIQESYRSDIFTILRLKEEPTLENARSVAKHLAEHAFGVVLTENGFAVRVKTADKSLAYCLYNEALTLVCGAAIIGTAKSDAFFFQVCGVPTRMTDVELAKSLSIPRVGQSTWTCHPETRLGQPKQGTKTILVKATAPSPKR